MNIALLFPPLYGVDMPPLGIAYIAAQLLDEGHKVSVFCFNSQLYNERKEKQFLWGWENSHQWDSLDKIRRNFDLSELIDAWTESVLKGNPEIIGLSVNSHSRIFANLLADAFKKKAKEIYIIFGGPWCSEIIEPSELNKNVDVYVRGEGEHSMSEIARSIQQQGGLRGHTMPGTLINLGEGFQDNGWNNTPLDIDQAPFPALGLFDLQRYTNKEEIPIIFSRGCNYRCAFCTDAPMWGKYRMRNAGNIFAEMTRHSRLFGRRRFKCNDLMINGDLLKLGQFADEAVSKNSVFEWGGMARARIGMSGEFLSAMKKAGALYFTFGIESGAAKVLAHMGKPPKEDIARILRRTHEAGIKVNTLWMAGYPAERWVDVLETMRFLWKNRNAIDEFVSVSCCYLPRKSRLWEQKNSLHIRDNKNSDWYIRGKNYPWMRKRRREMLYLFARALGIYKGGIS